LYQIDDSLAKLANSAIGEYIYLDARFKAISSLKEIIVNVYDEPPSCDLREKMRGCGWTIEVTEREESESVGIFDGYDDYVDYDYYDEKRREEEEWVEKGSLLEERF
jgi:hypothetical protein